MNRFDLFVLAAVIAVMLMCADQLSGAAEAYIGLENMSWPTIIIAVTGWSIYTFGPILLCALFWRWRKRVRKAWLLHLLLLPCSYGLVYGGISMMLARIRAPDFDDTLGAPVMAGMLLGLIGLVGYAIGLAANLFARATSQPAAE